MVNISPLETRDAAASVIGDVLRSGRPFESAFGRHEGIAVMAGRDRAFVQNLTLTTFRRLGQIDQLIDACLARPLPKRARDVRDILRIGCCQLLFMDVADHGAVDTCVELTRSRGHGAHIELVNAILRRLSREGAARLADQDAARENTPDWLWQRWSRAYGEPRCREIAEAHMRGGTLDLSIKGDPEFWSAALNGEVLPLGTVRAPMGGLISELPGFRDGEWWVQDVAARMVASLAGDIAGKTVIDLCAAPGGKTALFASGGGRVTAVDRSAARLRRLRENLARLALDAEVVEADAALWRPRALADVVMLDAPCSATGTARRHPDVLWTKSESDIEKLAWVQSRMLRAAAEMVAPGGLLVFATCSLQPEEGEEHVASFLDEHPRFNLVPVTRDDVGDTGQVTAEPGVFRSLPSHFSAHGGSDGFFAARFRMQ